MRKRSLLLSFSGIDGSGKTTQVEMLENRLKQNGISTVRMWSRWRPLLSLPLLQVLRWGGQLRVHKKDYLSTVEFQNPKNEGVASLWCFATQLENFLKTSLKISLPLALGRTVVCDRYTLDLLVDGMSDLHDSPNKLRLGFKLLSLLPRPDWAFLIDTDADVAFKRKPDLPTVSHNVERIRLFLSLCDKAGVKVMDGRRSPDAIHQDVWDLVSGMISSSESD
jgi:thymidylate kinase